MSKRRFIQGTAPLMLLAQLMRGEKGDAARAIARAESLWERLSEAGYGAPKASQPREVRDHVAALPPALAERFTRLELGVSIAPETTAGGRPDRGGCGRAPVGSGRP